MWIGGTVVFQMFDLSLEMLHLLSNGVHHARSLCSIFIFLSSTKSLKCNSFLSFYKCLLPKTLRGVVCERYTLIQLESTPIRTEVDAQARSLFQSTLLATTDHYSLDHIPFKQVFCMDLDLLCSASPQFL